MTEISVDGWIIHKQWSGDTSARVTFFTREHGLIIALFKGGRVPKKQAILQAFTPIWVYLRERLGWYYVQKVEPLSCSPSLARPQLFAGLYINELLYHLLKPLDAHPELYDAYETTVCSIGLLDNAERLNLNYQQTFSHGGLEVLLRRFEWTLLSTIGHGYSLTHDARTRLPIEVGSSYQFVPGEGLIADVSGVLGSHLLAIAQDQLNTHEVLQVAKKMMRAAVDHALEGKELKARRLYQSGRTQLK